jgi:hypothetical protein
MSLLAKGKFGEEQQGWRLIGKGKAWAWAYCKYVCILFEDTGYALLMFLLTYLHVICTSSSTVTVLTGGGQMSRSKDYLVGRDFMVLSVKSLLCNELVNFTISNTSMGAFPRSEVNTVTV